LLSVFMSTQSTPRVVRAGGVAVPHYPFPEEAARALSLAARYGAWRTLPDEAAPVLDHIDHDRAVAVIAAALAEGGGWMAPRAMGELLACYGIPLVETRFADSPRAAGLAAKQLG